MSFAKPEYDAVIFAAMEKEVEPYASKLEGWAKQHLGRTPYFSGTYAGKRVAVVQCGLGPHQSADIVRKVLNRVVTKCLFLSGCAGAFDPDLPLGSVVVTSAALDAEHFGIHAALRGGDYEGGLADIHRPGDELLVEVPASASLIETAMTAAHDGFEMRATKMASSSIFPAPENHKDLRAAGAGAIDMEAFAFLRQAFYHADVDDNHTPMPAVVVKGMSNHVNMEGEDTGDGVADHSAFDNSATVILHTIANLPETLSVPPVDFKPS